MTPGHAKIVIVVDDDIDPHDIDSVVWALAYRMQPDTDVEILPRIRGAELDPSAIPPGKNEERRAYVYNVDRCYAKVGLSASISAGQRIYGRGKENLGGIRAASFKAQGTMVWLFTGLLVKGGR